MFWFIAAALVAVLAAVTISGPLAAGPTAGTTAGAAAAPAHLDVSPLLDQVRSASGIPGCTAAVARDGAVVASGVAGVRALGDTARVRIDDPFLIGSCAKQMLRLLIARLAEAGTLSFDTKLGDVLKDVPMRPEYRSVTLAQVLAFRGGIRPYTEIGPKLTPWLFQLKGTPEEERAAFTAHVLSEEPAATPGTKEVYSNAAYAIAAHVAERLAGKPWETLIREQVFQPLGMSTAFVGVPGSEGNPAGPQGHFRTEKGYERTPGPRQPLPAIAPAGMVSCSVTDFARFAGELALIQADRPGAYLDEKTAAQLNATSPIDPKREGILYLGGEGTFTAAFALWPSEGVAIVAQTNGGGSDGVCRAIIEAVRAGVAPDLAPLVGPSGGRLGVVFVVHNEADWEATDVKPGSPADKAGIQPGDRLAAINGVPIARMPAPERDAALKADRVTLTMRRGERTVECLVVVPPQGRP